MIIFSKICHFIKIKNRSFRIKNIIDKLYNTLYN